MRSRLFQLRQSRRGVSVVTANVLMVAMTVGMAGSMFVMVTNMISPYTPPSASYLSLQSAGTYASRAPDYCCLNDTFVQIIDVTGDPLFWGPQLSYVITASDGEVLIRGDLEPAPGSDFYLGVFHAGPGMASIPVVGFIDIEPLEKVSAADTLQIYGMSEEFHGAELRLIDSGKALTDIALE